MGFVLCTVLMYSPENTEVLVVVFQYSRHTVLSVYLHDEDAQAFSCTGCGRSQRLSFERRPGLIWRRQDYHPHRPPPREWRWTPGPSGCSGSSEIQAAIPNVPGSRYVVSSKDLCVAVGSCYCPGTIRSGPRSLKY